LRAVLVALALLTPASALSETRPLRGAVELVWLPVGMVFSDASGERSANRAESAHGLAASFDTAFGDHFSVAMAWSSILDVKADTFQQDSSLEMELAIRPTGWLPIGPRLKLFGYAAPGVFVVLQPSSAPPAGTPFGALVAVGAGVTYWLSDRWFLVGHLDAHHGFRLAGRPAIPYPYASAYLGMGAGAGLLF
jgi:hypothetical protein